MNDCYSFVRKLSNFESETFRLLPRYPIPGCSAVTNYAVLRCKQCCYKWSSRLWLLRLSLYRGVNNEVMNDCVPVRYAIGKVKPVKQIFRSEHEHGLCDTRAVPRNWKSWSQVKNFFVWVIFNITIRKTPLTFENSRFKFLIIAVNYYEAVLHNLGGV